jgi:acetolactate synthase-1/2/3 large subunit
LPDIIDYGKLAETFGLKGFRADNLQDLKKAIDAALKTEKTAIIRCDILLDENVWPIVPPGDSIENQRYTE